MKWKAIVVSTFFLTANAFGQNKPREVPVWQTNQFETQFETISAADEAKWSALKRTYYGIEDTKEGFTIAWVQPSNKKEACKIFFATQLSPGDTPPWNNKKNRYYWDGECKSGYAIGIGREFEEVDGGLRSALADYKEVHKEPSYYLDTDYDRNTVTFRSKRAPLFAALTYSLRDEQSKKIVLVGFELTDFEENKVFLQHTIAGGDDVHYAMTLPNKNRYMVLRNSNPINSRYIVAPLLANGDKTGYGILATDNGINKQVRNLYYSTATDFEDVVISASYRARLIEIDTAITKKIDATSGLLEESYAAISKYKRKICKGEVKVSYVDNEIYGRICLEDGELSRFAKIIDEAKASKEARYQVATEEVARQKEKTARDRQYEAEKQQRQGQQQAAQAQARARNNASTSDAVADFAQGMQDFSRRSADFTQGFVGSMPNQSPNFGNQGSNRVNCFAVSNIISCR